MSEAKQQVENVIAGVDFDDQGYPMPTAAGRYCEWEHRTIDKSADIETFEDYMKTLQLKCEENGKPAILNWTVDANTPDLVYYQVNATFLIGVRCHDKICYEHFLLFKTFFDQNLALTNFLK